MQHHQKYFYTFCFLCALAITPLSALFAATARLSPLQQKVLLAPTQQPYQWFASTDTKKQNHDYLLLKPGETRKIPLAEGGLVRLWCTASIPDQIDISIIDGKTVSLLKNDKAPIGRFFQKAFTLYPQSDTNSPLKTLTKSAVLVATNHAKEENKFFYQATVRPISTVSETPPQPIEGNEVIINAFKKLDAGSAITVGDPGQLSGGVIRQIQISSSDSMELPLNTLLMQVTAGSGEPIVQVPLAAFVGGFDHFPAGANALSTWDKKTLTINWPMPASSGDDNALTIKIQNIGQKTFTVKVHLSFIQTTNVPQYLFCARSGSANSVEGQPFSLAVIDGSGALVGVSADMGAQPDSSRRTFAFLEGNETITADTNVYTGTGTEDFFNSAWYFPAQTYSHPYDGISFHSNMPPRVAASRWLIDDAIPFHKQLSVALEHGNGNRGTDLQYHWYVFWYQQQPVRFELPEILHSGSSANTPENASKTPQDSPAAAIMRVLVFTAFFGAMLLILLVALARYGQRKK